MPSSLGSIRGPGRYARIGHEYDATVASQVSRYAPSSVSLLFGRLRCRSAVDTAGQGSLQEEDTRQDLLCQESSRYAVVRRAFVVEFSLELEPNVIQLVELVDRAIVSFDAFWRTLHNPNRPVEPIPRHVPTGNPRYVQQHTSSPAPFAPMAMNQAPMRPTHPSLMGLAPYGSGSDVSQGSSMMPKPGGIQRSSGATVPPFVSANKPPLQFISAGFKAPTEYAHLTPGEQLAQLQNQEGHRIQPSSTGAYSINKHFRQPY